jgi:hypothetical protein
MNVRKPIVTEIWTFLRMQTEVLTINVNIFRAIFLLTFGAMLLEAKSSGHLYLKSA